MLYFFFNKIYLFCKMNASIAYGKRTKRRNSFMFLMQKEI